MKHCELCRGHEAISCSYEIRCTLPFKLWIFLREMALGCKTNSDLILEKWRIPDRLTWKLYSGKLAGFFSQLCCMHQLHLLGETLKHALILLCINMDLIRWNASCVCLPNKLQNNLDRHCSLGRSVCAALAHCWRRWTPSCAVLGWWALLFPVHWRAMVMC